MVTQMSHHLVRGSNHRSRNSWPVLNGAALSQAFNNGPDIYKTGVSSGVNRLQVTPDGLGSCHTAQSLPVVTLCQKSGELGTGKLLAADHNSRPPSRTPCIPATEAMVLKRTPAFIFSHDHREDRVWWDADVPGSVTRAHGEPAGAQFG